MAAASAGWLLVLLLCGCPAAPSELELTVDLGTEQVEIRATLRDVQVWTEDPVEALWIFQQIHAPEATVAASWLRHYPWLPKPQRWEWQARGETLDLALAGSMPRAQFDACLATPLEERSSYSNPPAPCEGFPLWREGDEYRSFLEERPQTLGQPTWMPLGATRWPLRERRLQTRVRFNELPHMKGSALPSFQLQVSEPEAVSSYVPLIDRYRAAFRDGDTPACKAIQLEASRVLPPRIWRLFDDGTQRERLWLIASLSRLHGVPPTESLPNSPESWVVSREYAPVLLPRQPPPEVLLLKLVRLHDEAVAPFGVDWESGTQAFDVRVNEGSLEKLCAELRRKTPAWRRPCQHMVDTRSAPP